MVFHGFARRTELSESATVNQRSSSLTLLVAGDLIQLGLNGLKVSL